MSPSQLPPGQPGIPPTWSSSAKDMVSTALGPSRLWATFGYGIVNEVYWPSTGEPQIRDLGFIVSSPSGWHEVKRAQRYTVSTLNSHVPLVSVVHEGDDYRLELEFLPHPLRDVLLIRFRLEGEGTRLYALLAPHLDARHGDVAAHAGLDLMAENADAALSLGADCGFSRTSAGYVGVSDGWQDFARNGAMTWTYPEARTGNVALMGELASQGGLMALGFAVNHEGARTLARSALAEDYETTRQGFIKDWEDWARTLEIPYAAPELKHEAELSAMVIKCHEDKAYGGSIIASLSIPWGSSHDDIGGYHLVWTRDAVEAALALITVGQVLDASRMLAYLIGTQAPDGSWPQNFFPDGRRYWMGNQLDEVALPLILVAKLRAIGALMPSVSVGRMVRAAVGFIVRNGPMSDQDRWEENAGANPFTLAVTISALVATAEFIDAGERDYVLGLADCWNERVENLTYVRGGSLAERYGVEGHYVRIAPRFSDGGLRGMIDVRNRIGDRLPAEALVGMEYLYLVRMGLRRPDDRRILDTLRITDDLLRRETPGGIAYYRYNSDGYGEHEDGAPFDGTGIGRLWPLLAGERGHYAVLAGDDPHPYLDAMLRMTGPGGLIPEQVWDSDPIPPRGLFPGKPTGSAMPLVWAHAEFLKLLVARATKRPTELMESVITRYGQARPSAPRWHWRPFSPFSLMPAGKALLIEAAEPFVLHWSLDGWAQTQDSHATAGPFGMYGVAFSADHLPGAGELVFTLYFTGRAEWEHIDHRIRIAADAG